MATGNTDDERYDYLVRPLEPDMREEISSAIEADPTINIVKRLGPPEDPHTFVVSMSARQADALKQRYAGELIVERDRPLTSFREV